MVDPGDEGRHEPGPEKWWNESWYADVADIDGEYGAWLRFGLYPNRSQTWFHLVVARRGQPVVIFSDLQAPLAVGNEPSLSTTSWSCEIATESPLRRWRVSASAIGRAHTDPGGVYRGDPGTSSHVQVDLTWHSEGEPYHYGVTPRYEISAHVTGTIEVDGRVIQVDAPGQRDHSWAVRDWWAFSWCWSAGAFDDASRFHLSDIRIPDMAVGFGYRITPDGTRHLASSVHVAEDLGANGLPATARFVIDPDGHSIDVQPLVFSPLLFESDDGRVSRFPRALCRYTTADGRIGAGWTEWNQIEEQT